MPTESFLEALGRLAESLQPFDGLIRIIAYVAGFGATVLSLYAIKTRNEEHRPVGVAFLGLACGALLMCFPSFVDIITYSLFGQSAAGLAQTTASVEDGPWANAIRFAITIVMLVGYFQMIKALIMLRSGAAESGRFWSAMTHLFGGCLCVNIKPFLLALGSSVGGSLQKLVQLMFG